MRKYIEPAGRGFGKTRDASSPAYTTPFFTT